MDFRYILSLLLICVFAFTQAQEASHSSKLPWVEGQMPRIRTSENRLIKISASGNTLKAAKQEATKLLIQKLASERGVIVNIENITRDLYQKTENKLSGSINVEEKMSVKSGDFEVIFSKIDEYYEYRKGHYELWALFLVAENGDKLSKIPTLAYKTDNGAWRSIIVPGWAQFYTKQPIKGLSFLLGETVLLSSGFYLYDRYSYNNLRSLEANTLHIKQEYRNRAKNYKTYSYITFGAALGVYVYNLIDAFTSRKGKVSYNYKAMRITMTPSVDIFNSEYCLGTTLRVNF